MSRPQAGCDGPTGGPQDSVRAGSAVCVERGRGVDIAAVWRDGGGVRAGCDRPRDAAHARKCGASSRRTTPSGGSYRRRFGRAGAGGAQADGAQVGGVRGRRGGRAGGRANPAVGFDECGFLASIDDSLRGATRLMHNARGDLTGVVRERGASDFYAYDPCQNRVYHAATEHGAALAPALDKASRERATMGDIPVDLVAARFPHHEASFGYEPGDRVVRPQERSRRSGSGMMPRAGSTTTSSDITTQRSAGSSQPTLST